MRARRSYARAMGAGDAARDRAAESAQRITVRH